MRCSAPAGAGLVPPAGGVTFSPPKKSPKSRLKPRFQDFLFCGAFYETNCRGAPSGTLFSIAVLTLQCAACPAAQHFVVRDACHGHRAGEFRRLRAARRVPRSGAAYFANTVAPAASCFPLVATSGALPRNSLASSAAGGASLISSGKVGKTPLETKVSRLPFLRKIL